MAICNEIVLPKVKLPRVGLSFIGPPKIFGVADDSDYEIVEGEPYLTQEGDANNLLLGSDVVYENNAYLTHEYNLYNPSLLTNEAKVTVTIWGKLSDQKERWLLLNSDGSTVITAFFHHSQQDGKYTAQTYWHINSSGYNTKLRVFAMPQSTIATSRIDRIKLELGWNDNPVWTPAPPEVSGDENGAILLENGSKIILEQNKMRIKARSRR